MTTDTGTRESQIGDEVEVVRCAVGGFHNGARGTIIQFVGPVDEPSYRYEVSLSNGDTCCASEVRVITADPKIIPASELREGMRVRAEFECVINYNTNGFIGLQIMDNVTLPFREPEAEATTWHLISEPEPEYVDGTYRAIWTDGSEGAVFLDRRNGCWYAHDSSGPGSELDARDFKGFVRWEPVS